MALTPLQQQATEIAGAMALSSADREELVAAAAEPDELAARAAAAAHEFDEGNTRRGPLAGAMRLLLVGTEQPEPTSAPGPHEFVQRLQQEANELAGEKLASINAAAERRKKLIEMKNRLHELSQEDPGAPEVVQLQRQLDEMREHAREFGW